MIELCSRSGEMEHGSFTNDSFASFTLAEEDHTLANAVRFMLNQELVLLLLSFNPFLFVYTYLT